jgi:hypothetical protein
MNSNSDYEEFDPRYINYGNLLQAHQYRLFKAIAAGEPLPGRIENHRAPDEEAE